MFYSFPSFNAKATDDFDQRFIFGFEPTGTNYKILRITVWRIIQKGVLGSGEGVLATNNPTGQSYQQKFLASIRTKFPSAEIVNVVDSHGELSYSFRIPHLNFSLGISTDAGSLEFQTTPKNYSDLVILAQFLDQSIFNTLNEIGINKFPKQTGGHITFSGFGSDTFLYRDYLQFMANHPELDMGFFTGDGYNAVPFARWSIDQQKIFLDVIASHDKGWKDFLVQLEKNLQENTSVQDKLDKTSKLFERSFVQDSPIHFPSFVKALAGIFENFLIFNRIGETTKPKYVAHRPGLGGGVPLIEDRAHTPPRSTSELLLMAKVITSTLRYLSSQANKGNRPILTVKESTAMNKGDLLLQRNNLPGVDSRRIAKTALAFFRTIGLSNNEMEDLFRYSLLNNSAGTTENISGDDFSRASFVDESYGRAKANQLFESLFQTIKKDSSSWPRLRSFIFNFSYYYSSDLDKQKQMKTYLISNMKHFHKLEASEMDLLKKWITLYDSTSINIFQEFAQRGFIDILIKHFPLLSLDQITPWLKLCNSSQLEKIDKAISSSSEKNHLIKGSILDLLWSSTNLSTKDLALENLVNEWFTVYINFYAKNSKLIPEYFDRLMVRTTYFDLHSHRLNLANELANNDFLIPTIDDHPLIDMLAGTPEIPESVIKKIKLKFINSYFKMIVDLNYGARNVYQAKHITNLMVDLLDPLDVPGKLSELLSQVDLTQASNKLSVHEIYYLKIYKEHLLKITKQFSQTEFCVNYVIALFTDFFSFKKYF